MHPVRQRLAPARPFEDERRAPVGASAAAIGAATSAAYPMTGHRQAISVARTGLTVAASIGGRRARPRQAIRRARVLLLEQPAGPIRAPPRPRARRRWRASTRAARSAPAFESGSLRLPHFGDCTHDGQPLCARALGDQPLRVAAQLLEARERRARDADAARVPVVDEDRRHAGLRVEVGRQPADVPAVAHRDQRQHGDLRVLGRVQRAEQRLERKFLRAARPRRARTTAPGSRSSSAAARAPPGRPGRGRTGAGAGRRAPCR